MIQDTPPISDAILQSILQHDYAALLFANAHHVIKATSLDKSFSINTLEGIELSQWLPLELLNGTLNKAIVNVPDLDSDRQFLASIIDLPKGQSHLPKIIALQHIPQEQKAKTVQTKDVEQYKKKVIKDSPIFVYILDYKTKLFTEGLAQYAQLLGYSVQEIRAMPEGVYTPVHPDDIAAVEAQEKSLHASDDMAVSEVKFRLQNKQGEWLWFQCNSTVLSRDEYNEPLFEVGSFFLLPNYENNRQNLLKKEKYFRTLVENSYDCILMFNKQSKVTYISPSVTRATGYQEEDILGFSLAQFIYEPDREDAQANMRYILETPGASSVVERRIKHKDGHLLWIESRLQNHFDDPDIQGVTVNFHVITERKQAEKKIHNLANYDPLTHLPNRYLFKKRLLKGLADCLKVKSKLALMYIDLDRFKEINDTLGHSVGDALLQSVSQTIEKCLRQSDTLARVGGDEFTIVLPMTDEKEAEYIAERILQQFRSPFKANDHTVQTGASIGISIFPNHTQKAEDLFRFADIAMYNAKKDRNSYAFYETQHSEREDRRRMIEKKLKLAIANGDLRLYYQPRVDIQTGVIKSVEALCRWYDPESGDISPGLFIPIAEESAMVNELSKLVTDMACKQVVAWRNMGIDTTVAINLSIKDLQNFDITRQFAEIMAMYDIKGESLEIEITESAAMTDVVNTVKVLNEFKELGIKLSIDDFGKGYSSLAYLSQLPVDNLKIDMYFVQQLGSQKKDRLTNVNIIRSIISLARSLDLKTVGEGIETVQQISILQSLGCELGQGMLYCRPLSANAITDILKQGIISFPTQRY